MAKFTSFIFVILAASFVSLCLANGNDYQWGSIGAADTLMAKELVHRTGFLGTVTTEDYVYQQAGVAAPLMIHYIKINDKKKFKGATATITSGGVGFTEVTIRFTSLRGSGIKSQVEIYGSV
uniref:Salivary secreted peptide n=1 Tax=Stomoxys calcitrans TaxID=35570 RepID=A0A1I8PYE3_STOCA